MAAAAKIGGLLIVVYLQYVTDNNCRALITGRGSTVLGFSTIPL